MPTSPINTDPRFWILSEALASYAGDPDDPLVLGTDRIHAAVALVLRGQADLDVLLIKRAESPRDPWSGHMALPGGRADDSDRDLMHTAERETLEETGLDLAAKGSLLGRLDPVAPGSTRLPPLTITPFVFGTHPDAQAHAHCREVDAIHWVPLDELRSPETRSTVTIPVPGGPRDFPCYLVDDEVVWGLTYRILEQFLERFPDGELAALTRG